jgi:hypothetical protein
MYNQRERMFLHMRLAEANFEVEVKVALKVQVPSLHRQRTRAEARAINGKYLIRVLSRDTVSVDASVHISGFQKYSSSVATSYNEEGAKY